MITVVAAAALRMPTVCLGQGYVGQGPLPVRNGRTYQTLFLQFLPEPPSVRAKDGNIFDLQLDIASNLLLREGPNGEQSIEDHEMQRLRFGWRKRLGSKVEFGAFLPLVWRNGGFLDEAIQAWHRLFRLPGEREPGGLLPRNHQARLLLRDSTGKTLVNGGAAFGPGDLTLTLKRALLADPRFEAAVRLGVKLPTGETRRYLGSGGVDTGAMVDISWRLGREFWAYGGFGGAVHGVAPRLPEVPAVLQYFVAVEWAANSRDSWIWQIDGGNPAIKTGIPSLDGQQTTASFGYRRRISPNRSLRISFTENGDYHANRLQALGNTGADFQISIGLDWRN